MLDINPSEQYAAESSCLQSEATLNEEMLIKKYLVLVKRVVNQLRGHANNFCSIEDMQQIGLMGLLEAGRRYGNIDDPSFPPFAVCRIRGSILDELRRLDWRPRQARQQAHELNDVTRDLTRKLGHPPSREEVIEALGISNEEYQQRLLASMASEMQSLDKLLETGAYTESEASFNPIEHEQLAKTLQASLHRLAPREQLLLTLFYQHELNLHEIALVLDLTAPRVCQLHKQALQQLNHYLTS